MTSVNGKLSLDAALFARQQNRIEKLPASPQQDDQLLTACNEFEAVFTQQMLSAMRQASFESELVPKSSGEKVFESMLDEQRAQQMASTGSLGLGRMIYEQLREQMGK